MTRVAVHCSTLLNVIVSRNAHVSSLVNEIRAEVLSEAFLLSTIIRKRMDKAASHLKTVAVFTWILVTHE